MSSMSNDLQRTVQRQLADAAYSPALYDQVLKWRAEGLSLGRIAFELNALGERTRFGLPYTPEAVRRLLARAERLRPGPMPEPGEESCHEPA